MNLKLTPLFEEHKKRKARIVPFSGYKMPLSFSTAKEEHWHVRKDVGLFDVSHMGEISIQGEQALSTVSYFLTNSVSNLLKGQCQYALICNNEGGILDDLIVYCINPQTHYLLCVNAGNSNKILEWILNNNRYNKVKIVDESHQWGQLAVQGPKARSLVSSVFGSSLLEIDKFHFVYKEWNQASYLISRTGYSGEDGFEILSPTSKLVSLWQTLLEQKSFNPLPIGLAARDTLRLEMKYPLSGQDMNEKTTPYEMGLKWACKNSFNFIGKKALEEKPISKKWVGFQLKEHGGIPRSHYSLFSKEGQKIGHVTSGILSPSLNKIIGTGMVRKDFSSIGTGFFVEIHGKSVLAEVVKTPFYRKKSNNVS